MWYLKTNIQGAVGLQTEWRTNVGLRVAAKSPSSHSQSLSGLLDICYDPGLRCLWFNWEKEVMWTQVDMTGDGVKELVVVTTRGVQVNKKQNEFPKWDKYSLTSCYWHQSRCLSRDVFSMVLIFQVLQADLGSVKKVTIERLRSLVAAISWKKNFS